MNYLVNPDISEEIDGRETDPLTGNIIGAAIDVHRALEPVQNLRSDDLYAKIHYKLAKIFRNIV